MPMKLGKAFRFSGSLAYCFSGGKVVVYVNNMHNCLPITDEGSRKEVLE